MLLRYFGTQYTLQLHNHSNVQGIIHNRYVHENYLAQILNLQGSTIT